MKQLKSRIYLTVIAALLSATMAFGQVNSIDNAASDSVVVTQGTTDILLKPHPSTGAMISVHHSYAIEEMIKKEENGHLREVKGFRIQIFSGNKGTTSRNRAFEIKNAISEKEPTLDIYVTYTSPFWKVRVGNCASHDRAQELRSWIIKHFPEYATETYIVPSTVLIP